MDNKQEYEFMKIFLSDGKLRDDLRKCTSPKQALSIVRKLGFDVELGDFMKSMVKLNSSLNPKKGCLTENDLESVSGGRVLDEITAINCNKSDVSSSASAAA